MKHSPASRSLVAGLLLLSLPSAALADRAAVRFNNGGCLVGELTSYVPGTHVGVKVGDAEPLTFSAADVAAVEVAQDASCAPPAPVGPSVSELRVRTLLLRRAELASRHVGTGFPITVTVAGGVSAILGLGVGLPVALLDCSEYDGSTCREDALTSGLVGGFGLAAAIAGGYWLRARLAQRRAIRDEIRAIDLELGGQVTLSLAPWLGAGARGQLAGVRTTLSF